MSGEACARCPVTKPDSASASVAVGECTICPANQFVVPGSGCTDCQPDTTVVNNVCICNVGFFQLSPSTCLPCRYKSRCPGGAVCASDSYDNSSACSTCAANFYSVADTCRACPENPGVELVIVFLVLLILVWWSFHLAGLHSSNEVSWCG